MKFRLPRPNLDLKIIKVIRREIKRQRFVITSPSQKILRQFGAVCQAIEEKGLPENLVCKRLPGGLGFGVFLRPDAKPILKGELIGSYAGKVSLFPQNAPDDSAYAFAPLTDILLSKNEQTDLDPKRPFHPRRLYALDVDAVKIGNFTRFINHSEKPNLEACLYRIPKNKYGLAPSPLEVLYVAKKTIKPGQQLLVSYEGEDASYWNYLKIKPTPILPNTFLLSPTLKIYQKSRF